MGFILSKRQNEAKPVENNKSNLQKDLDKLKENIKNDLINQINKSIEKYAFQNINDIDNWAKEHFDFINSKINSIKSNYYNSNKNNKCTNIINNNNRNIIYSLRLLNNYFTSKDIQNEYLNITQNFEKDSYDFARDQEEKENESIAKFFIKVAFISREAFNLANNIFISIYNNFISEEEKLMISSYDVDQLKKKISKYIKENENNKLYENFFSKENELNRIKSFFSISNLNAEEEKVLLDLYEKLSILYFHCKLSFPSIEINFKFEGDKFITEKMIDFINKGSKRKVNFVILPSLFSNGCYLENGKIYVFTYKEKTFRFDKEIHTLDDLLIKKDEIFKCPSIFDLLNFQVNINKNKIEIIPNIKFSEKIEASYSFYFFNPKNKNGSQINTRKNICNIPNNYKWKEAIILIGNIKYKVNKV